MFVSQVKMLNVVLFLTDTHMFSIKIKMVTIVPLDRPCTLARMRQETLLQAVLIYLNMQYSDLNMVMLKLFLILWHFGKLNSVILQMAHKLWLINLLHLVSQNGMFTMVWLCYYLTVLMDKVLSILVLVLKDIYNFVIPMIIQETLKS